MKRCAYKFCIVCDPEGYTVEQLIQQYKYFVSHTRPKGEHVVDDMLDIQKLDKNLKYNYYSRYYKQIENDKLINVDGQLIPLIFKSRIVRWI